MTEDEALNLFGGIAIFTGVFMLVMVLISMAVGIFFLVTEWKLYKKMGEPGWKVLIPIYNQYILFKRVWNPKMFVLALLLSIVPGIVVFIMTLVAIGFAVMEGEDSAAAALILSLVNIISPLAGIGQTIINIILSIYTAKAFGKDSAYSIGLIFLPIVFRPMLAFGKAQYVGNMSVKNNQNVNYQNNNYNPQGYRPSGYGNGAQGYNQPYNNPQNYNQPNNQQNYNLQNNYPQNYNQGYNQQNYNQNNQNGNNYPPQY